MLFRIKRSGYTAEDYHQLNRELIALKKVRTQHINRIKGLLAAQGKTLCDDNSETTPINNLKSKA